MKLPVSPTPIDEALPQLLRDRDALLRFSALAHDERLGPAPGGKYRHWDTFRHAPPLDGFSATEQWLAVKMARRALYRTLPLRDVRGLPFRVALPNPALEMLHEIDRYAGGNIQGTDQIANPATRDTYLFKSLVEEAITSSQLEGASTTRRVAKAMIQEGREPRTRSERMIRNNYEAMVVVRHIAAQPLTPAIVMELQRIVTEDTLDDATAAGRFRRADEQIVIEDETGERLHTPPDATELESRLNAMCEFANGTTGGEFIPPAVRAIILHFWLAYDHPFVDGNGRTARALFYWSMARQGYWLSEYVSISRILKKARGQYARAYLYSETDDNDVTYFLLYQLRVVVRAITELHAYLARTAVELRETQRLLDDLGSLGKDLALNPRQLLLLNHALRRGDASYNVESHRRSHGVSYETARNDLLALAHAGLLDKGKIGRAFVFRAPRDLRQHVAARADTARWTGRAPNGT